VADAPNAWGTRAGRSSSVGDPNRWSANDTSARVGARFCAPAFHCMATKVSTKPMWGTHRTVYRRWRLRGSPRPLPKILLHGSAGSNSRPLVKRRTPFA